MARGGSKPRSGPRVLFNVLRHPTGVLVKRITTDGNGGITKAHGGQIPRGSTISTRESSLRDYIREAFSGGTKQYVLPANVRLGTNVPISPKAFIIEGGVDRTAETLKYVEGPAVLTLDYDPSPYSSTPLTEPSALHGILAELFPDAFANAAWGAYDSSGSFIYDQNGLELSGRRGFHVVFAVADAREIRAFGDRLFKHLWLAGYGYIHISKDGKALPRTIFDKKVIEPQQPLFAGGAHCIGCEQRRPEVTWQPGGDLNTAGVLPLSLDQANAYVRLVDDAKRKVKPQCDRMQREYLGNSAALLASARNISPEKARAVVEARLGGKLVGNDLLRFDEYGEVTVAEVLANLERYDEATLADPIDGDVRGKAMLFRNVATGTPIVYSHAHGGGVFRLMHDLESLLATLAPMDKAQTLEQWLSLLSNAELRADELDQYLNAVKKKTGLGIGTLRDTVRNQYREAAQADAQSLTQDPGLYIADLLLERRYEGGTTLIKLETDQFWFYSGTHWTPVKDAVLIGELHGIAEEQWGRILAMCEATKKKPSTLAALVSSALSCLGAKVVKAGDPLRLNLPRPSVINCLNGELWLEKDGPDLRSHRPDSYLTSCSPIKYDPTATAPKYEVAMRGILSLPGGIPMPDQEEMFRHLEELLGYSIQTRRNFKIFVILHGPGDDGKSTLVKLLLIILGHDAVAFDRLAGVDEKGNRFATARLLGKQVLVDDDVDAEYLLPDGLLKKIAEEKPLTAENKFRDHFSFVAQVVPWLLANSWPRCRDLTRGMQTRAQVIHLPRSFLKPSECSQDHPDRQRPELWEQVFSEEMSGVLNRLIAGYYRVVKRIGFLPPKSAQEAFDMWLAEANVVSRFINEGCEKIESDKSVCTTSTLYADFDSWCDDSGVQARHRPQLYNFGKRLTEIGVLVKHNNQGSAVYGVMAKRQLTMGRKAFEDKPERVESMPKAKIAR